MLTITIIFESLSSKDLDPVIDMIMPVLLKKAADANVFITASADKATVTAVNVCSENKMF